MKKLFYLLALFISIPSHTMLIKRLKCKNKGILGKNHIAKKNIPSINTINLNTIDYSRLKPVRYKKRKKLL